MDSRLDTNLKFSRANLRLSVKYNFIVYPIDFALLQKVLSTLGYQVVKPPSTQDLIMGGVLHADGRVAVKENLVVDSLTDKQVLGINGTESEKLIPAFEEVENGLSVELGQPLDEKARFYELVLHYAVETGSNPIEVFANLGKRYPYSTEMSKILGNDVSPFSYRVSPSNVVIDSENWFDFVIEPLTSRATSSYHIGIIYRNKSRAVVIEFLKNIKFTISEALKLLESTPPYS